MKDLPIRALVAFALIGLLLAVLFFGGWFQAVVLGLFSALSVFEMRSIFKSKGFDPFIIPQVALGAVMFALMLQFGAYALLAGFFAAFLAIAIERILNKRRKTEDAVASVFILFYPLALLSCFGLVGFDKSGASRIAITVVFAGVAMADNTAYMVGSLIGKHKLCPAISPNKTVEGAVSGLLGGALGGILVYFIQRFWSFDYSLPLLVGLCFIAGLIGQFGDLFSSTFKRWAGVKDFGSIFPGHGGIIDRLDSALFAVPVVMLIFGFFIG